MRKLNSRNQKHRQYIGDIRVAVTMLDGSRTFEEIAHRSYVYLAPLGLFKLTERQVCNQAVSVKNRLEDLIKRGWIIYEGERYALTSLGREEVSQRLSQLSETGKSVSIT
ncbi:MAG: hypothetical protein WAV05_00380 [Anaerolineales bacterium]